MSNPIILYDLPGNAAKYVAWSWNTWKARFVLNMKGLPYKTVWVEYPDIVDLYKKIGIESTSTFGGKPYCSLPVIQDLATGAVVADSLKIAQYLDDTYPSTMPVLPAGTRALQTMFVDVLTPKIGFAIFQRAAVESMLQLPPRSQEYFRRTREEWFGVRLEEMAPEGEKRDALWKKTREVFAEVHKWMNANGEGRLFVMGDTPSFADAVLVSFMIYLKVILGSDSKEWKDIMVSEDGRWAKLLEFFAKWEVVDEEGLKYALGA